MVYTVPCCDSPQYAVAINEILGMATQFMQVTIEPDVVTTSQAKQLLHFHLFFDMLQLST